MSASNPSHTSAGSCNFDVLMHTESSTTLSSTMIRWRTHHDVTSIDV